MSWTTERIELLKKLFREGVSYGKIADQLGGGITRNAVTGKLHRLGLGGKKKNPQAKSAAPATRLPYGAANNILNAQLRLVSSHRVAITARGAVVPFHRSRAFPTSDECELTDSELFALSRLYVQN